MTGTPAGRRWTVASAARRGVEILRGQGPKGLLYGILAHLGYRRLWIFELGLGHALSERSPPEGVEIEELRGGREEEYLQLRCDARPEAVAERLRSGHRCFLARAGGRVVSAQWAAVGQVPSPYLGEALPLGLDEACSYDSFTAPDLRAKGLGRALRLTMAQRLHEAGYRRLLSTILPENLPPIRLVEGLGYERIGTVHSLRLGPLSGTRYRMSDGRRPPGGAA